MIVIFCLRYGLLDMFQLHALAVDSGSTADETTAEFGVKRVGVKVDVVRLQCGCSAGVGGSCWFVGCWRLLNKESCVSLG